MQINEHMDRHTEKNEAEDWSRVCREELQYTFDERLSTIDHK